MGFIEMAKTFHLRVLSHLFTIFQFPLHTGHRLEWDVETGGLTTRHQRKPMMAKDVSYTQLTPVTSEMVTPTTPIAGDGESCSDVLLEKIVEEETSPSEGPTSSIASPGSDEKYLLLRNGGHSHSVTVTKI